MKKTILMILAVLPIVLVVVIAFAGRILSVYQHISVERVEFVNESGDPYGPNEFLRVEEGTSVPSKVVVYPELASNKKVTYTSANEEIFTVDENGVVTGVNYGSAVLTAKTEDGGKIAMVNVLVTHDTPRGVTLSHHNLDLTAGQKFTLSVVVELPVAVDKRVEFTSSDTNVVKVDTMGNLTAVSEGTAVITVRTLSGNHTDTCTVTVTDADLPVTFDFSDAENLVKVTQNGVYVFNAESINILECLRLGDGVDVASVAVEIRSGSAVYEDGVLTFTKPGFVTLRAYDNSSPDKIVEVTIAYQK